METVPLLLAGIFLDEVESFLEFLALPKEETVPAPRDDTPPFDLFLPGWMDSLTRGIGGKYSYHDADEILLAGSRLYPTIPTKVARIKLLVDFRAFISLVTKDLKGGGLSENEFDELVHEFFAARGLARLLPP